MNRRKYVREISDKYRASECPIASKMSSADASTFNTNTEDDRKVDSKTETMQMNESQVSVDSTHNFNDDSSEINYNLIIDPPDEIQAITTDLIREADILMASVDQLRRENNSDSVESHDCEIIVEPDLVDNVQHTHHNNSIPEITDPASQSTISSHTNVIDDSVVIVDDSHVDSVQSIVHDDDVIFVTEVRQRQRTIATIDLCDIPDSSFVCTNVDQNAGRSSTVAKHSPKKPTESSSVGMTKCPICLEKFTMNEILSTFCGHLYCEPCIRNVIKTRKKCPMCNRGLKSNQVHRIFLEA